MTPPDPLPALSPTAPVPEALRDPVAEALAGIACEAGRILRGFHGGDCPHVVKPDGSPASLADARSEELIVSALTARFPGIPVIAEETSCTAPPAPLFFLVDPLDGTRDFLAGNEQYCVNICLVQGDRPVAAALAAPGLGRVWAAGLTAREASIREGRPTAFHPVTVREAPADGLVALVSRLHGDSATDACLERLAVGERRVTSSALKFCLIAAGEADIYIRCAPTMEWDTAAGDHVLTMAGGTCRAGWRHRHLRALRPLLPERPLRRPGLGPLPRRPRPAPGHRRHLFRPPPRRGSARRRPAGVRRARLTLR